MVLILIGSFLIYYSFRSPEVVVESYIKNIYKKNKLLAYLNIDGDCRELYTYKQYSDYVDSLSSDTLIKIEEINLLVDETQNLYKRYEVKLIILNENLDTIYKYCTIKSKYYTNSICELNLLVKSLYNMENKSLALVKIKKLKAIDIYNANVNYALAILSPENSIGYFDNSIKFSPKNFRGYYSKALYLTDQGKFDLAIYNYISTLKYLQKDNHYLLGSIYANIATAYFNLNKNDSALKYNSISVHIDSNDSYVWWQRSWIFNDNSLKIRFLKKAFEIDDDKKHRVDIYLDYALALYNQYLVKPNEMEYLNSAKTVTLQALDIELENEVANGLLIKINKLLL